MTHLLQPIQTCVQAELGAGLFQDVTEVFARGSLDRGPACRGVDDYYVRRHVFWDSSRNSQLQRRWSKAPTNARLSLDVSKGYVDVSRLLLEEGGA